MSDEVTIALIAIIPTTLAIVIPVLTARKNKKQLETIKNDTAKTVSQLDNDHVKDPDKISNIREDNDHKHNIVMEKLEEVGTELKTLQKIVINVNGRVSVLEDTKTRDEINKIIKTMK